MKAPINELMPMITTDVGVLIFSSMPNARVNTIKASMSVPAPVLAEKAPPKKPMTTKIRVITESGV